MRKILSGLLLVAAIAAAPMAEAQVAVAPPAAAVDTGAAVSTGPAFWPFVGFLGLAFAVELADANGVPFPLCGFMGLSCYDDYGNKQ